MRLIRDLTVLIVCIFNGTWCWFLTASKVLSQLIVSQKWNRLNKWFFSYCLHVDSWIVTPGIVYILSDNYANPVYNVSTICHQVCCLRWGHPSLFHTATSLFIWYKMFRMRDISYRLIWMKFINMLSVFAQCGTHRHFNWWIIAVLI